MSLARHVQLNTTSSSRMSKAMRREAFEAYIWISPWIIGFLAFTVGPMIASAALSLTDYGGLSAPIWNNGANYSYAFTNDRLFYGSFLRTFYYAFVSVPLSLFGSFILAVLLDQKLRGESIFRTLYYLPSLTPMVAMTILWLWILQPQFGLLNFVLRMIGIEGPAWFGDTEWAIPSLIIMNLWNTVGGGRMIIFLAALQGVPESLYDAAEIDGSGIWHKFWHITFPMVSPAFLFNLILGVIGALNIFETALIATEGGPARATWFYALHIYYTGFRFLKMGYACALAWLFFAVIMLLTLLQIKLSNKWVYYEGEV